MSEFHYITWPLDVSLMHCNTCFREFPDGPVVRTACFLFQMGGFTAEGADWGTKIPQAVASQKKKKNLAIKWGWQVLAYTIPIMGRQMTDVTEEISYINMYMFPWWLSG